MGKISNIIRTICSKNRFCSAIILSAGNGTRFSQNGRKQDAIISGKSVLLRSVEAFEKCDFVSEIIVVTNKGNIDKCRDFLTKHGISKLSNVVSGGETRSESTSKGFAAINPESDFVAVHDAARCLITVDMIKAAFESAFIYGAAACGSKIVDTVKRTDTTNSITETIDRENLWAIQTPQIFSSNLLRAAIYYAEKDNFEATDECGICERIGYKINIVDVGKSNLKITYPEDIIIAEAILKSREQSR